MKKLRVAVLAVMITIAMSVPYIAFGYGDYTSFTNGSKTEGNVSYDTWLTAMSNYYTDSNGKLAEKDKDSLAISYTGDTRSSMSDYARVKTYADTVFDKYPVSFLFDGGNYSMGTPYQTIFGTEAPELRTMGSAGYDVSTIGTAELALGSTGLADMLKSAAGSGDTLPHVVAANLSGGSQLEKAYSKYGVKDYYVVSSYGKKVAVFGLIGSDAFKSADAEGLKISDPVAAATKVVSEIKSKEKPDLIVCLYNSGNGGSDTSKSVDKELAGSVSGIDLIISSNSKTTLSEPVEKNGTEIVSIASGSDEVGTVTFKKSGSSYKYKTNKITALNGSIDENLVVKAKGASFKSLYNSRYFSRYGFSYGEKLTTNNIDFTSLSAFGSSKADDPLGNLIADAYLYSAKHDVSGSAAADTAIGVVSAGAVTDTIGKGAVTGGDAFGVLSAGKGNDGKIGYPVVSFYLKGSELESLAELGSRAKSADAASRLYFSGLSYTYNPHRVKSNKVYDVKVAGTAVAKDKSYRLVTDVYSFNEIKTILSKSSFAGSVKLKDKNGSAVTDAYSQTLERKNGNELKAWSALASYLDTFHGSSIPASYSKSDGRMIYDSSFNPAKLFKEPNKMTGVVISVVVIVIAVIILLIILFSGLAGRRSLSYRSVNSHRRKTRYPKQSKQKPIFSKKR
jgi:5'-nucleotidase/UDP-sugar diphosphatase